VPKVVKIDKSLFFKENITVGECEMVNGL